jgi:hypothetical protein
MSSSEWETMTESTVSSNAPSSTTASSVSYALSGLSPPTSYASSELATPIHTRIQRTKDTLATETNVVFDAECVKKRANWSKVKKEHNLVDYPGDPNVLLADIETHSPKLNVLLRKIKSLDESDMKEHGTHFKHMIFTDLKSNNYGVKIIASAMIANGMVLGYTAESTGREKKKFSKIQMLTDAQLQKTKGSNFYLMSSVTVFDQPISVATKKDILARFNARPDNVHGENVRFIVMDSGFKEGIDLFDIKYVHIFEPQSTVADQKQVIGRGTRTCGQKGLQFQPNIGWPLHVFVYDIIIPEELRGIMGNVETTFQLYMKSLNLDLRLFSFTGELERATIQASVDYDLNENIHMGGSSPHSPPAGGGSGYVYGGARKVNVRDMSPIIVMPNERMSYDDLRKRIRENFGQYKWDKVKMENLCDAGAAAPRTPPTSDVTGGYVYKGDYVPPNPPTTGGYVYNSERDKSRIAGGVQGAGAPAVITLTPTQNFLKHYFIPSNPIKGMLLWHSTGSGKTCSAIAAASNEFEKEGYTILWVTRTTLKNDIWKNMFDQVCHEVIRTKLSANEIAIPSEQPKRMKLLSPSWRIRPMSYKQFSNLVSKQNQLYDTLVKINGASDPLRKTLIIIDEAHKLYGGGDLSSIERPDMNALHASLLNSYAVSGRDSVRLLLMTATPITTNPMEMVKLLNLCKPIGEQMPVDFGDFSTKYLDIDTGKFSTLGMKQYLDDTAGYVSYLNREKDARQFSQPVLHQIRVPLVKMSDVAMFDKRAVRELVNSDILKLKDKIEAKNDELIGELNDLDVNKFKVLRKECEAFNESSGAKTTCNKIAQKNMRKIVQEAREEVKRIKNEIKHARESIRMQKIFKKENLVKIAAKIEASPEDYENFKQGAYYNLKTKCGKTFSTESELLKEHPDLEAFIRADEAQAQKIKDMENMLKISEEGFKNRISQLKQMLKTDLRDIERSVVKLVIKDVQKNAVTAKRKNLKTFGEETIIVNKTRKAIEKQRKKRIGSLKRELKEQLKDEKAERKEILNGEKVLKKELRKQDEYMDDIKHGVLTGLVDKYKDIMKEQLTEEVAKEAAKKGAKMAKETAKKEAKVAKEAAKNEAKMAKEAANNTKKLLKQEKKLLKEAANKTKKLEKEAANKTKKLQKDALKQEKELAKQQKAANKTRKANAK